MKTLYVIQTLLYEAVHKLCSLGDRGGCQKWLILRKHSLWTGHIMATLVVEFLKGGTQLERFLHKINIPERNN